MKHVVAALLVAACQSTPPPPPPPPPAHQGSANPVIPDDLCKLGIAAIDRASCPGLKPARASLEAIAGAAQKTTVDPHGYELTCARLIDAVVRDTSTTGCSVPLDPAMQARVAKAVEAYYAQRTAVTPTGNAEADAWIAKIAAMRDTACACKDQACIDQADAQLVKIEAMPGAASQAARDLATQLLDDAARCAQRVKMGH
jgi:hypothetical protein